ncbi:MAG TPA: citrate/2-methylcitrate synthase [Steroidobacteraceae bacterium]
MSTADLVIPKGLEGVEVDTTSISLVDGQAGRLSYRGYVVEDLMSHPFAAAVNLVVFGELPDAARLAQLENDLCTAGELPEEVIAIMRPLAATRTHPMVVLQSIVPLLAIAPPKVTLGRTAAESEGLLVAARLPAAIAAVFALMQGRPLPQYPKIARYGERFLTLLHGRAPSQRDVQVFERTQILQIDHGFNASTFTARVVASTLAPAPAAMGAAMGALFGPLHGGADQAALEMAEEIGDASRASAFVDECLANRRRVMGMGHREYRVVDPRARIIKGLAEEIATEPRERALFETLVAVEKRFVERTAERKRAMRANLEFYKGVVYAALGIPKNLFTPMFAAARSFGWAAHIVEQLQDNRLIRPAARYIGRLPELPALQSAS